MPSTSHYYNYTTIALLVNIAIYNRRYVRINKLLKYYNIHHINRMAPDALLNEKTGKHGEPYNI